MPKPSQWKVSGTAPPGELVCIINGGQGAYTIQERKLVERISGVPVTAGIKAQLGDFNGGWTRP
jgi:hypothetical protein